MQAVTGTDLKNCRCCKEPDVDTIHVQKVMKMEIKKCPARFQGGKSSGVE